MSHITLRRAAEQARSALNGWANHGLWAWPESALQTCKQNTEEALAALDAALAEPPAKPDAKHPGYITAAKMEHQLRITCGFVDVQFDGEKWFCAKCGERMNEYYEEMVKHSSEKDYLELMQRKAAFKIGRNKT